MANATLSSGASSGGIGSIVGGLFGSDDPPKPQYYDGSRRLLRGVSGIGQDVLSNIRTSLPGFYSGFAEGTGRQRGLQGEQEQILRTLLQRRLSSDPQQQLRETGNTLFSFIDPNVVAPLARFDVNYDSALRRARGLNPSTFDSTADRLRRSRVASGRYYDVARQVYGQLPQVYQQLRDAGITDEMLAAGVIPQIQAGYRNLDLAPLIPLRAGIDLTREAIGIPRDFGAASAANIYGFHQPMNLADRFAQAGSGVWNTVKDAAQIYASLYGGGAGGIGGMMGGGGGGGGGAASAGRPAFSTVPSYAAPQYVNPYFSSPIV